MAFKYQPRSAESMEARANQQGGGFEGFIKDQYRQYGPKNGDNAIRILPRDASEQAQHYGEEVWVHYNVGPEKATVICLFKMMGEPCPCCEERQRAEKRGDEETAKELKPSKRVVIWMLDRKNEDQGPLIWGMPWTVDRDIAKACRDRETGKFYYPDDPERGYDIYFDRSGNPPMIDYAAFQLSRKPNSVPEKILDFISNNPLLDTLRLRDYDEVKRLFEGGSAANRDDPPPRRPSLNRTEEASPREEPKQAAADEPERREVESEFPPADEPPHRGPEARDEPAPASTNENGAARAAALRAKFANRGKS